jgi:tetratricopeptide (TPR) repeat protein
MSSDNDRLNLLLDLRRYADAEKAARAAIGRDPQGAAAYTHLARALMGQNKKEAIDAAREGARKAPHDAWAVGTLACALNWFGQAKEALEPAEQTVKLDPRYSWAYAMLSNVLFNLNRFKEAHAKAVEGLRFDPLNESLFRWKGWAEHKMGQQKEALLTAEEGLKHHPNSHLLLNLIGCVRWTQAEKTWGPKRLRIHRDADKLIRESIRLDPTQPAYRDNLRGNALSCRRPLVVIVLTLAFFAFTLVPVFALAIVLVREDDPNKAPAVVVVCTLVALAVAVGLANCEGAALVAPLTRFGVPAAPVTPVEHRAGRVQLAAFAVLAVAPHGVLAWALLK